MMKLLRFRDLEYFIAIAAEGSLSRAAEACGISQPTLSAQLKRMEELLGVTLVERRHGSATITAEGAEVLEAAREIMDSFYRVQRTTSGDGVLLGRKLRFGVLPTIAPYFAPAFLTALTTLNDKAQIDFVEDRTDALELAVNADTLDFAITATSPRVGSLVALPLTEEGLSAISLPRLPGETVTVDDLAGPLLLMQEGNCFRDVVTEAIRRANARAGAAIKTKIGPSSFATLISLVRAGMGQTLVPEPFVRQNPAALEGLSSATIVPAGEGRQLQLIVRRGREGYRDVERLRDAALGALGEATAPA
ncbi:MAG: LysR family transcriptional regulator [Pseudomonadota bacterium]